MLECPATQIRDYEIGDCSNCNAKTQNNERSGRLVVTTKSAGLVEFRLVGGRQFRQVSRLIGEFCTTTGIRMVELK